MVKEGSKAVLWTGILEGAVKDIEEAVGADLFAKPLFNKQCVALRSLRKGGNII